MDITWTQIGLFIGIIVVANIVSTILLSAFTPKPIPPIKLASGDIMNLISELNAVVDLEFISVVEAPNKLHKIDTITDFDKVQKEITKNVVDSLSTKFFIMANNAGVKRSYVLTIVTRRVTFDLFDYMRKHNFTPRKG